MPIISQLEREVGEMRIDPYTRQEIEESHPFVCLLHDSFAGSEGEAHLQYAISLNKHIVVWRAPERAHLSLPDALADYADYIVVDGTKEELVEAISQCLEAVPGDEVVIHHKGYGEMQEK